MEENIRRLKSIIESTRDETVATANEARLTIANQLVELTNLLICSANDLVVTVDETAESRLNYYNKLLEKLQELECRVKKETSPSSSSLPSLSNISTLRDDISRFESESMPSQKFHIKYCPYAHGIIQQMRKIGVVIENGVMQTSLTNTQPESRFFNLQVPSSNSPQTPASTLPSVKDVPDPSKEPARKIPKNDDQGHTGASQQNGAPRNLQSTSVKYQRVPTDPRVGGDRIQKNPLVNISEMRSVASQPRKVVVECPPPSQSSVVSQSRDLGNETDMNTQPNCDTWEDYCYVCDEGTDEIAGDLGCCTKCPKVYHNKCHVPRINQPMIALPNDWTCARCIKCVPLKEPSSGFGEKEQLLCSKIYLWCFKYKQITDPFMKFDPAKVNLRYIHIKVVAAKLSQMAYKNIPDFLRDMELVISSAVEIDETARNHVRLFFKQYSSGVKKYLPCYTDVIREIDDLCPFLVLQSAKRKRQK